MKHVCFIFFLLIATFSSAQFAQKKSIGRSQKGAESFEISDLDNDGLKDFICASKYDHTISWYKNLGNNLIGPEVIISIFEIGPKHIHAADIDGDGDQDLFSANIDEDQISWYENLGGGNFSSQKIISSSADSASFVFTADVDGDGNLDVLSASMGDDKIAWYKYLGGGLFGPEQTITNSLNGTDCLFPADLDGDGDIDILATSKWADQVIWFENDGSGLFAPGVILSSNANYAEFVTAADFDNDGDLDPISASTLDKKLAWYENLGGGLFGPEQIITIALNGAISIACKDLDNDGDIDILSCGTASSDQYLFQNDGTGIFSAPLLIPTNANNLRGVLAEDLNNDGWIDIANVNFSSSQDVVFHINTGGFTFGPKHFIGLGGSSSNSNFISADVDGDNKKDIIVSRNSLGYIGWYKNLDNDNFSQIQIIAMGVEISTPMYIGHADFDLDGIDDIVLSAGTLDSIFWLASDGNGGFGPKNTVAGQVDQPSDLFPMDVDQDGDYDVVAYISTANYLAWYENLGGGVFGPEHYICNPLVAGGTDLCRADLDNDGDDEILVAILSSGEVSYFENISPGIFGPKQIITTTATGARCVTTGDLDNDGDLDVVVAAQNIDAIYWYENLGGGTFGPPQLVTNLVDSPIAVITADINMDGNLDLVSGSSLDSKIAWYENLGFGNFAVQQIISLNVLFPGKFIAEDIDSDGDIDIYVLANDEVIYFENQNLNNQQISGRVFIDLNNNHVYDSVDVGIYGHGIFSNPTSDFVFTYNNGEYIMSFSDVSGQYQIIPQAIPGWSISTDSLFYTISLDTNFAFTDSLDFGFYPDVPDFNILTDITGASSTCNTTVNYWLSYTNGTIFNNSGIFDLLLDDSLVFYSSNVLPDSIVGQHVYWSFNNLPSGSMGSIQVQVIMPNFLSMGQSLNSYFNALTIDSFGTILGTTTDSLSQILTCAYDPNDKIAFPVGIDSLGYIPANTNLIEYTIRFQNTGTDTAKTVSILDQLDSNLDWTTMSFISSSHPVQICGNQNGEVIFLFENIMLPDSNTNLYASNGFVKYSIQPTADLPIGTSIYNTANIYFDQNPAITTNTKINTLECIGNNTTVSSFVSEDTVCVNASQVVLSGSPIGGNFYGLAVIGNSFDPSLSGAGFHYIWYEYIDGQLCSNKDSSLIVVNECLGIDEQNNMRVLVYPNPFHEKTTLFFNQPLTGEYALVIYDMIGQIVYSTTIQNTQTHTISRDQLETGTYILSVFEVETASNRFSVTLSIK